MSVTRVYEQAAIRQVTGDAIRPGGLALTERALDHCALPAGARVLDVGCGAGATVERLCHARGFEAVGIDPSRLLLESGKRRAPGLRLCGARGEALPFALGGFDALLAECCLSLMADTGAALGEFNRVLRAGGALIVSDIYARSPDGLAEARRLPLVCCLGRAMPRDWLVEKVERAGFRVVLWEDHSPALRRLAAQIIMMHGSMVDFWRQVIQDDIPAGAVQQTLARVKPGYFLLIAAKHTDRG
ncbi:MAG: class I SAM-dependent methyltransferase [Anaerolineae bacterium]|nr:class I SAM-dependent methyltransferase [Anaerolineae bacterium]